MKCCGKCGSTYSEKDCPTCEFYNHIKTMEDNQMKTLKFNNPHMSIYMKSMGKLFKVTAICLDYKEANEICEKNREMAVIGVDNVHGLVYLAEQYSAICPSSVIQDMQKG